MRELSQNIGELPPNAPPRRADTPDSSYDPGVGAASRTVEDGPGNQWRWGESNPRLACLLINGPTCVAGLRPATSSTYRGDGGSSILGAMAMPCARLLPSGFPFRHPPPATQPSGEAQRSSCGPASAGAPSWPPSSFPAKPSSCSRLEFALLRWRLTYTHRCISAHNRNLSSPHLIANYS